MDSFDEPENPSSPTPQDIAAYMRGLATPEQSRRIQDALQDHDSELNQWLREMETWSKTAFPGGGRASARLDEIHQGKLALDGLIQFIRDKQNQGSFSAAEVSEILVAGGLDESASGPPTGREADGAVFRMLRKIHDLHPELSKEASRFRSPRSR